MTARPRSSWETSRFLGNGEDCWPPHEVSLELVEGCALRCSWCGVHGIREDNDRLLRLMPDETWVRVAREIRRRRWYTRVLLSGRGEPLLHPHFDQCLDAFQRWSPRTALWVETSGFGLAPQHLRSHDPIFFAAANRLASMVEAGVSAVLVRRRRGTERVWDVLRAAADDLAQFVGVRVLCGLNESHPTRVLERHIWLAPDNTRAMESHSPAENYAGAGAPPGRTLSKQCLRPTKEMAVRWDGRVAMCQADWRGEVCLGDITHSSLWDVFYGPVARAARARLNSGLRDLRPCSACDHIPDLRGRSETGGDWVPPESEHRALIEGALAAGSMTVPVLRPWERGAP